MKNKGRPTIYQTKYCQEIINWMANGYSIASFAGKIGVGERTIYDWVKNHKDFSQSIKIGKTKSILFWEKTGMNGMNGKIPHFNATVWIFQMKNRLGWSDKLTVDSKKSHLEEEVKQVESSKDTLIRLMAKYRKRIDAITQN